MLTYLKSLKSNTMDYVNGKHNTAATLTLEILNEIRIINFW